MSIRENCPCDVDGVCPYGAESWSHCDWYCGEPEESEDDCSVSSGEDDSVNIVINNINDIVKGKGLERPDQLEHFVYKYTECGAWIQWDDSSVTIGSIVEGSDAEFDRTFSFPVNSAELDDWINELEQLCDEAWHEANDDWDRWECESSRDDWDEEV